MFPTVHKLRFFEANVSLCSCFGEMDAELYMPGMEECKLSDVNMDGFRFSPETVDGFYEDQYDGLMMTHHATGKTIFFDLDALEDQDY